MSEASALPGEGELLWEPSTERRAASRMADFMGWVERECGQRCDGYDLEFDGSITIGGLPNGKYLVALDANGSNITLPDVSPISVTATDAKPTHVTIDIPASEI